MQGQAGWHYGYRNFSADGGDPNGYNPATDFIEFAGGDGQGDWDGTSQFWTGSLWDLQTAATGPWDELGAQNTHPNGPSPVHWTIRRWQALTGDQVRHADSGETFDDRARALAGAMREEAVP